MKQKIGIDFTYIREDSPSGIRKAGEDILEGLSKINKNYEIVLFVDERLKDAFKNRFPQYKIVVMKFWFKKIKYIRAINVLGISKIPKKFLMKREKCDVIIHPYAEKLTPFVKNTKKVVSILDVITLDTIKDKESKEYKKEKQNYINFMNETQNIVTLSEYSKKRLMEVNPKYTGTITVIPTAVVKLNKSEKNVADLIGTSKPYIFTINSFFRHKNQITLVKAFDKIKNQIIHQLVLVGRPELNAGVNSAYHDVVEYINKHQLKDRITVLSNISDEDRNALFYNTDLFVSTSLQEGFGRTPVEAAMCEVPVISTVETSLPEATKGLVFYYNNATDPNELGEKILEVLNNKPTKENLEKIAEKLEQEYDETKIANEYMKVIEKLF